MLRIAVDTVRSWVPSASLMFWLVESWGGALAFSPATDGFTHTAFSVEASVSETVGDRGDESPGEARFGGNAGTVAPVLVSG